MLCGRQAAVTTSEAVSFPVAREVEDAIRCKETPATIVGYGEIRRDGGGDGRSGDRCEKVKLEATYLWGTS